MTGGIPRDDKSQESEYREEDPKRVGEWVREAGAGENQAAPSSQLGRSGHQPVPAWCLPAMLSATDYRRSPQRPLERSSRSLHTPPLKGDLVRVPTVHFSEVCVLPRGTLPRIIQGELTTPSQADADRFC